MLNYQTLVEDGLMLAKVIYIQTGTVHIKCILISFMPLLVGK